ncbi:hypothetical protein PSTG_18681, partial [Puccinia striiformis f. sp. tritici PST-78]
GGPTTWRNFIVHLFTKPGSKSPALIKDQHEAEDGLKECNFQYRAALLFTGESMIPKITVVDPNIELG